jgi:hypothetical protein
MKSIDEMKRFSIWVLLLISMNSYAQIYNVAREIKFDIVQMSKNDSLKREITLILHGDLWKIPVPGGKTFKTEEDNWAITWISNGIKEHTGVFENDNEIFLHPPRSQSLRILEFCPFPIVHYPLKVSMTWDNVIFGISQGYYKAINSKVNGKTDVTSKYTVTGKISWYSPFQKQYIDCYEINAIGYTKFGDTSLQAYFSEIYGFVYLNYETLNGDRFVFTIKSFIPTTSSYQLPKWY